MTLTSPWADSESSYSVEEKRDAVLRAAVALFNQRGFYATSLNDVARALEVSKPTIYHYFDNKEEILFECLDRGIRNIRDAGRAAEKLGGDGMTRLTAYLREYGRVVTSDFGSLVARTADRDLAPVTRARVRASKREIDATLRRVVEEGMRDGTIAQGDARIVTFTLSGALNYIAHWYDPDASMSAAQVAEQCVSTLILGLAPRPKRRPKR